MPPLLPRNVPHRSQPTQYHLHNRLLLRKGKVLYRNMLIGVTVPKNTDRRRSSCLHTDHQCFIGEGNLSKSFRNNESLHANGRLQIPASRNEAEKPANPGSIRGYRQIEGVFFLVYKIVHTLCRRRLFHASVQPTDFFQPFLKGHQSQWRIGRDRHFFMFHQFGIIFRTDFDHHSGVGPTGNHD